MRHCVQEIIAIRACNSMNGRKPNFRVVDFVDGEEVLRTQKR
jgi:hypothetical protein